MNNEFSLSSAKGEIGDQIKILTAEIREIRDIIQSNNKINTRLRIRQKQKELLLQGLQSKQEELNSMNGSYGRTDGTATLADERIARINNKLSNKQRKLHLHYTKNSQPKFWSLAWAHSDLLRQRIFFLSKKKGRLERRQRKITNIKLALGLNKMKREAKKQGKIEGIGESLLVANSQYNNAKQVAERVRDNDGGLIDRTRANYRKFRSFLSLKVLTAYAYVIDLKEGFLEGARELPQNLRDRINRTRRARRNTNSNTRRRTV